MAGCKIQLDDDRRPIKGAFKEGSFIAKDSQDNALATATVAASTVRRHYITDIVASYSAAKTGLLQIKLGATVVFEHYFSDTYSVHLETAIVGNVNEAVSAELAASGTGGVVGKVNILGFTV